MSSRASSSSSPASSAAGSSRSESALPRRAFLQSSLAAGAAAMAFPLVITTSRTARASALGILGRDEHTYEMVHDWLMPPAEIKWGDTHGLAQDRDGRIYVAHTVHPSSEKGDAVVVFDEKGAFIESFGAEFKGGAHGLDLRAESGEEFLYHCDTNRRLVVKTNLKGEVIWTIDRARINESGEYTEGMNWVPTNACFAKNGDVFIGDGYGSSFIHRFDINGNLLGTIARPGRDEGRVNCPHGLWVDARSGEEKLVVADRSNRRLQYFSLDGEHLGFVTEGMRLPCDFSIRGDLMVVPDLESVVTILDKENTVVAHLGDGKPTNLRGAPREQFIQGKFIHPHDALWLANGDILVAEWVPVGRITLLRKTA